jgi:hypothetical protein
MSKSHDQNDSKTPGFQSKEHIKQIVYECLNEIFQEFVNSTKYKSESQAVLKNAGLDVKGHNLIAGSTVDIKSLLSSIMKESPPVTGAGTTQYVTPSPSIYAPLVNQPSYEQSKNAEVKQDLGILMSRIDSRISDLEQIGTKKSSIIGL